MAELTLEQRVARIEERLDEHLLPLIDRVDQECGVVDAIGQNFVIPAILLLAGHGHHHRLREMLAMLAVELQRLEATELQTFQLRHWRQRLDEASKSVPGFPPPPGDPRDADAAV